MLTPPPRSVRHEAAFRRAYPLGTILGGLPYG